MSELTISLSGESAAILRRMAAEGGFSSLEAALAALLAEYRAPDADFAQMLDAVAIARDEARRANPSAALSVAQAREKLLKDA